MKPTKLSKREELLFELQGWTILNGTQGEYVRIDEAPTGFIVAAILLEAHEYAHRMAVKQKHSPNGLAINQFCLN